MSDTLKDANSIWLNSIWPNGIQEENEYSVFYKLGTNKEEIQDYKSSLTWPNGTQLKSPFVYDNEGKIVGFIDTKAMTAEQGDTIIIPYEHIKVDFSSIEKGKLNIITPRVPNGGTKLVKWKDTNDYETIEEVSYPYKGKTNDTDFYVDGLIKNGTCEEIICDLQNGNSYDGWFDGMFCRKQGLQTFNSDLTSLTSGKSMFYDCSALTSFTSDLRNLTNGYDMFNACDNLQTLNTNLSSLVNGEQMFTSCIKLSSFKHNMNKLTNGRNMFQFCSNLETFEGEMKSLTGEEIRSGGYLQAKVFSAANMFEGCKSLTTFKSDLRSLTNGQYFLKDCESLKTFDADLSSLKTGDWMFYRCIALESFPNGLSSLGQAEKMFMGCSSLVEFTSDLRNLTSGTSMFEDCTNLTTFNSNLMLLNGGNRFFSNCRKLTSFTSNLNSLRYGTDMFNYCKLDVSSVHNIIITINDVKNNSNSNKQLTLGIGCNNTINDKNIFAQNVGYSSMDELLAQFTNKGWTVSAQYNGSEVASYGLEDTLPVFVKVEEYIIPEKEEGEEEEEEVILPYHNFISNDGKKVYYLTWYHETTGSTEGYTQYNTLEEAYTALNIKPIERN